MNGESVSGNRRHGERRPVPAPPGSSPLRVIERAWMREGERQPLARIKSSFPTLYTEPRSQRPRRSPSPGDGVPYGDIVE